VEHSFRAAETPHDHVFFLGVVGRPGFEIPWRFDAPHVPLGGHYPTSQWRAGELLRDRVAMRVPEMRTPVELSLRLAVRRLDGTVALVGDRDGITLGAFEVRAPGS